MKKLCGLAKPPKVIIQKALTTAKALLWLEAYAEASKEELLLGSGKPVHEVPRPATNGSVSGSLVSSRNGGAAAKFVSVDLLSPTCLFLRDALEQRGIGYNPVLRRTRPRLVSLQRTEVFSGNAGPEAPTEDRKT
ncbi:MAG: hypothetical protein KGJ93_05630, partial [Patescibacteria group bacterium]|nr:hypothetical protein [Patescibacteria group bacterium]